MAPDAENYEQMERLNGKDYEPVPTHQGRRVLPQDPVPAQAWTEHEDLDRGDSRTNSPGENRRLLGPSDPPTTKSKSRLQAGLTLGVWGPPKNPAKLLAPQAAKLKVKTKAQRRKEKLIAALTPPYFILSMIILIVCIHVWGSKDLQAQLEWSPAEWWREPWRLLTYGWVHASDGHLAINALVALAVGWRLEREQSAWRVVVVWCGGVAGGALGAGALQPRVRVVGASAAVYALLTAHLPNVCLRFGHIPLWWFRPLSVVVLAASEGCWSLVRDAAGGASSAGGAHAHVAWAAHVFGAAVGIPVAFLVFTGENKSKRHVVAGRITSAAVLAAGVALAAVYYTCWQEVGQRQGVRELNPYHRA